MDEDGAHYLGFRSFIQKLFIQVDMGQYLDKEFNHYVAWKYKSQEYDFLESVPFDDVVDVAIGDTLNTVKSKVVDKTAFAEAYFRRIYYSNVYFFRCTVEAITYLVQPDECLQHHKLQLFALQYGYMLQIIRHSPPLKRVNNIFEQSRPLSQ